jgi:CRP-like cAMP-binding protein
MMNLAPIPRLGSDLAEHDTSVLPRQHFERLLGPQVSLRPKESVPLRDSGVFYLNSGLIKQTHIEPVSKKEIVSLVKRGELVDELTLFDGRETASKAVAVFSSVISFISKAEFERYISKRPELQRRVIDRVVRRLRAVNTEMMVLFHTPPQVRLARIFLRIAEATGAQHVWSDELTIPTILTQTEMAAMAGISREGVSRTLSTWEESKFLIRRTSYECVFALSDLRKLATGGAGQ